MSRVFVGASVYLKHFLLFALFVCVFSSLAGIGECWKLRDLGNPKGENVTKETAKTTASAPTSAEKSSAIPVEKSSVFRDVTQTIKKTAKILHVSSESGEYDDGVDIENEDSSEAEDGKKFVFERVHQTHFDLPKRPVPKVAHPDVEQEEKEEIELKEEQKQIESMFSPVFKLIEGLFQSKSVTNDDGKEVKQGFFEWLSSYRNQEVKEDAAKEAEESAAKKNEASSENTVLESDWKSYLNRKPFNILLNYFRTEPEESKVDGPRLEDSDRDDEHIDKTRSPLTTENFEELLLKIPSFVPNYTKIDNIQCKRMGQIFLRQIRGQKLWAVQMLDASSKIPSGLLRGNANQFGDFDLCTEIRTKIIVKDEKSVKIKGKYCLANVDIRASDEEMKLAVHLMQGRNLLRSRIEDSGHFLPRFSTLKWGVCVPHGCSHEDTAAIVHDLLAPYNVTGVKLFVDVAKSGCYVKSKTNWSELTRENWNVSGTIAYFLFFIALVIVASLNDYWTQLKLDLLFAPDTSKSRDLLSISGAVEENNPNEQNESEKQTETEGTTVQEIETEEKPESLVRQIILAFSVKRTSAILFRSESTADEPIDSIYGIKALATIMLFVSFKFLIIGHQPFTNRAHLTEILTTAPSIILRGSILFIDLFLFLSGFLAAQSLSRDLENRNHIPILRRFVGRFVRVTPLLAAVILFNAWLFEHLGNGPQWGNLVDYNADLCKKNIWPNLLHLSNWIPFEKQCAPHLQSLSVDMQLYLVVPLVVWLMQKSDIFGVGLYGALSTLSIAMRFSDTISERLSPVLFQGMKLSQLYRTLNLSFASPLHRATPYLFGVGFAALVYNSDLNTRLPKALNIMGWTTAIASIVWCFYAPAHLAYKDYVYEPTEVADYAAWAPLIWSIALCWIVYVCCVRSSDILETFLTMKPLVILGKISLEIYLVQFMVLFYFAASARSLEPFNLWTCLNFPEIALVISISIIFALTFGIPLQIIHKIIVTGGKDTDGNENIPEEEDSEGKIEAILGGTESPTQKSSTESPVQEPPAESSSTPKRRVSWNDKVAIDDPVIFRRPATPVWLKDEEDQPDDIWGGNDEPIEVNCNGIGEGSVNRDEDEPIEITLSDLEDELPEFSEDENEHGEDEEEE